MTNYDSRRYALANRWDSSHLTRIDRLVALNGDQRVLEVGCGRGHLTKALADRGIDIIGIDANPQASEVAETGFVRHMRAEKLEFENDTFDIVLSVHAIEHIPRLRQALGELTRVLKPRGTAVHIYPAEPIQGLYAIPTAVILYGNPLKARQVHCHKLWPSKLREMLSPMGMTEIAHEFSLFKSPQFTSVFEKTA